MESKKVSVYVWDLPVRVTHWSLVFLLGFLWWSGEEGGDWLTWHMRAGYAVLTLLLFRIVWGFVGSRHARFSAFVRGPGAVLSYMKTLPSRTAAVFASHNPLGALSVVLILLVLLVQVGTGLFANDDIMTEAPLYKYVSKELSDRLTSLHKLNFNLVLAVIGVHIAAVFYYLLYKSENLIKPMFTGRKMLPAENAAAQASGPGVVLAVVITAISAALVYSLVK